jgi:RND family efflux transporter MFP subunit
VEYDLEYNEGPRLERMEREVDSKKQNIQKMRLLGDSAVVAADIAVERARMNLEKQKKNLKGLLMDREDMALESPMAGLLLHGSCELKGGLLEKGKPAAANDPILTVAGEGRLEVRFDLSEEDYFKLKEGMAAAFRPAARPEPALAGELHAIETLPGPQGKWACRAKIEGLHEEFLPGMTCKIEIIYKDLPEVLLLPRQAVKKEDGKQYVYKVTGEGAEKTAVKTGDFNEKEVIIEEGLEAGDRVQLKAPEAAPPGEDKKMQVTDYGVRN